MSRLEDLVSRLETISDDLGDLSITRLREGLEAGDPRAAGDDKRYTRARRAVEKAASILRGSDIEG